VGRFGQKTSADKNREQLLAAGADYVAFSLGEARHQLLALFPVIASQELRDAAEERDRAQHSMQPA
jgi:hypothetical protein